MPDEDDIDGEYASPACYLHELDPSCSALALSPDQVAPWRKNERARLIRQRLAVSDDQRRQWDIPLVETLRLLLGDVRDAVISAYWPFRGEPDLRPFLAELTAAGAHVALPVVVAKGEPLIFRLWKQGDRLERGVWNIPYPAEGQTVQPDIVFAPVVGFDRKAYRLGYGGGFFDRTLAACGGPVKPIGVGYSFLELATIHPQPHDIPMRAIVTEAEMIRP